jgi:FkbM family methyltransferase
MSTTLRLAWIRALRCCGVRRFTAKSSLGYPFICHIGDSLGENPFYDKISFCAELELCAAFLIEEVKPVIFDVGANVGFWSTQLAQMLADRSPEIYSFEAAPSTFGKLHESIALLRLQSSVYPIASAVLSEAKPVQLSFSEWNSQFAQVSKELNPRVGDRLVFAAGTTLDLFAGTFQIVPHLIKIDVEGGEADVLRGAADVLYKHRPALLFEYNPLTLSEKQITASQIDKSLKNYSLYFVDDFGRGRRTLGEPVVSLDEIDWVCNIFAVPDTFECRSKWESSLTKVKRRLSLNSQQ